MEDDDEKIDDSGDEGKDENENVEERDSVYEALDIVAEMYSRSDSSYCCVRSIESFCLGNAARKHAVKCKVPKNSSLLLVRTVLCARRCMDDHRINVHTKAFEMTH